MNRIFPESNSNVGANDPARVNRLGRTENSLGGLRNNESVPDGSEDATCDDPALLEALWELADFDGDNAVTPDDLVLLLK